MTFNEETPKERRLRKQREYYHANKEKYRQWRKETYRRHSEEMIKKAIDRQKRNPESKKKAAKKYAEVHQERIREYDRSPHRRELARQNYKKRYAENPQFCIKRRLSARLWYAFKAQGLKKDSLTMDLVGSTLSEVKAYLENQFLEGMSWDNTAEWHIDHIRPCASFDLRSKEQQKECFHFSNLRPVWKAENRKKSSRWQGRHWRHK